MARIAILTNTYNHSAYLANMVRAVAEQSRPPDEFLILDDASTDGTWPLLEMLAARHPLLRPIPSPRNQGAVGAFRAVLAQASTDFVWSSASDDMLLPGAVEAGMALLERHPKAVLCCGQAVWWNETTGEQYVGGLRMPQHDAYLSPADCLALAKQGCLDLTGHTAIFRRETFLGIGGFRETLQWYSDWFALYALAFRHGLCWVARPQAVMRLHDTSFSAPQSRNREQERQVLGDLLDLLLSPAFSDVRSAFASSGVLSDLGRALLCVAAGRPRFWRFLTPRLIAYLEEPRLRRSRWGRNIVRRLRDGDAGRTAPTTFDLSSMFPQK